MCRIHDVDGDIGTDGADIIVTKEQIQCTECKRSIGFGEKHHHYKWYDYTEDGELDYDSRVALQAKFCDHCQEASVWLMKVCNGWMAGEVVEEIKEHYDEYRDEFLFQIVESVSLHRPWSNLAPFQVAKLVQQSVLKWTV